MRVDAELLARLETAAPRYTSYPTVPSWSDTFASEDHSRALAALPDEPLSLYVHIPFCKELCSYCGCNVVVTRDPERVTRYLDALAAELRMTGAELGRRRTLARLHFGGGTPTFLDEGQLTRLWQAITGQFDLEKDAELAIEIDPVVTRPEQLTLLGSFGFNRISMGVQDFDSKVQEAVNRVQSIEETRAAIEHARSVGFGSVNLDLIFGLPHQTEESFARTMDQVVSLAPDRVACFSFAYVPSARPNQRRLPQAFIPTGAGKLALREIAEEKLTGAGFRAIGMDHYARPEDELARAQLERRLWRDFQGYTTRRARATVAVGASAISDFGAAYAQNEHALGKYEAAIAAGKHATVKGMWLGDEDRARQRIIVQLMCNGWIDLGSDGEKRYRQELEALREYEKDGLLGINGGEIALSELGRRFVRNVASVFDQYLNRGGTVYSATI
jgi:oxygen-independent coproporphyrinogen-3 oxidase